MATASSEKDVPQDPEAPKDKDSPTPTTPVTHKDSPTPTTPVTPNDQGQPQVGFRGGWDPQPPPSSDPGFRGGWRPQPPPSSDSDSQSPGPEGISNFLVNPCICCELRIGVRAAGFIGIIVYSLFFLAVIGLWFLKDPTDKVHREPSLAENILYLGIYVYAVAVSIVLTIGAVKRHKILILIALIGLLLFMVVDMSGAILMITLDFTEKGSAADTSWEYFAISAVMFVTNIYVLYVIYAYFKQLTRKGQQVAEVGGAPSSGQFPVGPSLPTPQQSDSKTGLGSPNVGGSQSTIESTVG